MTSTQGESSRDSLEVHAEIAGSTVLAGRAQFHRARGKLTSTTFQYDSAYLALPAAYEIDPALRLVTGTQHTRGLPGAFADSAPDRWGRNLIKKRERTLARRESRRPHDFDEVDFLVNVSDITRQGALRYRATGDADSSSFLDPKPRVPKLIQLPALLRAADSAVQDAGDDDFEAVKLLLGAGTGSLGGARPKAAVIDEGGRQLIAKFPHHEDAWDVMAWEASALDLAAAAGVEVPPHQITRIDGRHLLLLDRFDRVGSGAQHRIGYMSAMTLLEQRDGEVADYSDIADRLAEVSDRPNEDAWQLFRRVAVNVGLNNTDDHLRNHGFLRGRAGWHFSPAFDVNPNPDPELRQTTIAGAETPAHEAEGLMALAGSCRLSPPQAREVLAEVAEAISHWRETAAANNVPASQFARFTDSFETGIRTLRAA